MDISLDYPVNAVPRWGFGRPVHQRLYQILNEGRERYRQHAREIVALAPQLRAIPLTAPDDALVPTWSNEFFGGIDLAALYMFVSKYRPARYVEIGSGWTTKVARRAAIDAGYPMHITSIDPHPRAWVDSLCDVVERGAVEDLNLTLARDLTAGDILFMDGSHRVFTNSDVVVFFLEILPELKPGIFVHIHDVFLPYDYPPEWSQRFYSEQYLLAAWLLAKDSRFRIEMPNMFVGEDPDLRLEFAMLFRGELSTVQPHGGSFWLRSCD